jgi:hypothetical protein
MSLNKLQIQETSEADTVLLLFLGDVTVMVARRKVGAV